ncbi:DTW domain-containing protein [Dioscorea alata]|uniref:DTW domain-containing protein n=1 Tax=Dioscorea alata TaxID=55571 RepID=A0ACB7UCF9_DIOAL|nr:DTW domain-containing protein [Dioscorea alata]
MEDDEGGGVGAASTVVGLIENRAKEVGVAAFELRSASIHLSQYIETSCSYQNTKTLLHFYDPMGPLKIPEDKKRRTLFQSLTDSEQKIQYFAARQIAHRVLGSRGYLCQRCWLAKEDCMCSRVVPCSLWNGIRFWLYMHPKDFLRQNNTGKLLWQLFGTQSVSLCIFGIHEHEEMMWDAFRSSGKEKIWFLYPSKSAAPKLVQDIFFNSSYSNLDGQMTDSKDQPLNFVLIDGTWSNSAAMYRRLKWSERRRFDLAGSLSSILRAQLHAYDPLLMMTLRYLMSIHKVFCTHQDIPSPISDITERFLFEDCDPPISSHESLYEVPPFEEVDIQALVHAAGLTRQDAVDSLRFAKGCDHIQKWNRKVSVKIKSCRNGWRNWGDFQHPTAFYSTYKEVFSGCENQSSAFHSNCSTLHYRWPHYCLQFCSVSQRSERRNS